MGDVVGSAVAVLSGVVGFTVVVVGAVGLVVVGDVVGLVVVGDVVGLVVVVVVGL